MSEVAQRPIHELTAHEVRELLVSGQTDVSTLMQQVSAFVAAADEKVKAFAHLDDRVVNLQAEHLQKARTAGELPGPLFGVPIAIKDIIDTQDFPTEYGSPIHKGRYSVGDATVVQRLRAAGAVIMGKTVTTEFATFVPSATCNPHHLEHTPGGSSSGSAAAVAAGMVPVAIGSQTNGSVIRPASYCGVYGFKPSSGLVPRTGVLEQSPSLDQIGVFARNIDDIALVTEVIVGDDGHDAATRTQAPMRLVDVATAEPPLPPKFCFVKTPWWGQVDPEAQEAYEALVAHLDGCVEMSGLPEVVSQAAVWHKRVNEVELAFCLQKEWQHHRDQLSPALQSRVAEGMQVPVMDYLFAKDRMSHVMSAFDEYFDEYDGILCPSALGTAPAGLASTGDPIMSTVWSFAGLPTLSLPLMNLSNGLPLGVQLVGRHKLDARLLRSARWLVSEFLRRNES
jgi:Asp-tRNA(Asn)/Glu-tRNA(Gln) amidotransferase A subunit family amidase